MRKERDAGFDNMKAALIFLVVFGHLIEPLTGNRKVFLLYEFIYTFHMPVFVFITGYFARPGGRHTRHILRFTALYLVFQTLYLLFDAAVLQGVRPDGGIFQYATPYWILWYVMALVGWYLWLPVLSLASSRRRQFAAVAVCAAIALLAGLDNSIGYPFSVSRFLTFLPFFAAGHYFSRAGPPTGRRRWVTAAVSLPAALALSALTLSRPSVQANAGVLYGSSSYLATGSVPWDRLLLLLAGAAWTAVFLSLTPRRKIPLITAVGRHTLWVFLLHGFLVKYIVKRGFFPGGTPRDQVIVMAVMAAAISLATGLLLPAAAGGLRQLAAAVRRRAAPTGDSDG